MTREANDVGARSSRPGGGTPPLQGFDYLLPKELIAQEPLERRDASRLLIVDRKTGGLGDKIFSDILEFIPAGDVLVLNDTKVFPARLLGKKKGTGGKADILLLEPATLGGRLPSSLASGETPPLQEDFTSAAEAEEMASKIVWRCLVQPVLKEGQEVVFEGYPVTGVFWKRDSDGIPLIEFRGTDDVSGFARQAGTMPLPPYIKREASERDKTIYQTVFAKNEGAVAAPTAGLHFTPELLEKLKAKGVEIVYVTLHVGYGTFKPVDDLENHRMHAESFELSTESADTINRAKNENRGVWAVGTTALRVLETCVREKCLIPGKGETDLFIKPPFDFEIVDHLLTNFHLPKTTLLLLVSAFMGEGLRKKAYGHAIRKKYRFYSYGDAMLIK